MAEERRLSVDDIKSLSTSWRSSAEPAEGERKVLGFLIARADETAATTSRQPSRNDMAGCRRRSRRHGTMVEMMPGGMDAVGRISVSGSGAGNRHTPSAPRPRRRCLAREM